MRGAHGDATLSQPSSSPSGALQSGHPWSGLASQAAGAAQTPALRERQQQQ